jgi:sarcosine oxidase / L-pipecolate oxidase
MFSPRPTLQALISVSPSYHLLQNLTVTFAQIRVSLQYVLPCNTRPSLTHHIPVVRSSYSDIFYSQLAREAIQSWKAEEWESAYHEYVLYISVLSIAISSAQFLSCARSGVLVLGSSSDISKSAYTDQSYENDVAIGSRLDVLKDGQAIRAVFPKDVNVASFDRSSGYLNHDGGWANATQGIRRMTTSVIAQGGKVITGKSVVKLLRQADRTSGVQFADGTRFDASVVVLAAGSWTASSFPDLDFGNKCIATG